MNGLPFTTFSAFQTSFHDCTRYVEQVSSAQLNLNVAPLFNQMKPTKLQSIFLTLN